MKYRPLEKDEYWMVEIEGVVSRHAGVPFLTKCRGEAEGYVFCRKPFVIRRVRVTLEVVE